MVYYPHRLDLQQEKMESSSSSNYRQSANSYSNDKRFLLNHLIPATENQSCTICLSLIKEAAVITVCLHAYCADCICKWSNQKRKCPLCNAHFTSLFVGIDCRSMTFRTQWLLPIRDSGTKVNHYVTGVYGRRRLQGLILNSYLLCLVFPFYLTLRLLASADAEVIRLSILLTNGSVIAHHTVLFILRAIGISRELNVVSRRTRPLPKQRSFGQSNMLPPGVSKERILRWRESIYNQNMLAVPCPTRKSLEQGFLGRNRNKETLLKRIEPWIHRELHAVLGDPNPAILVHLVTSLFISSLEETQENNHLESLQPFLLERTSAFWHELRCFAESSLNMDTYDTVVKYEKVST